MKNGDPRSEGWIKRNLRSFKRNNEATQTLLALVDVHPVPSVDEIRTWTPEQCLLAEDWAGCVHFSASDNTNRVPAIPEHLVPYQVKYPLRAAAEIARLVVAEMGDDNGVRFQPTIAQWEALVHAIRRMQRHLPRDIMEPIGGCYWTDAEIGLFAAGEQTEMDGHFRRFDGYQQAHEVMGAIFEGLDDNGEPRA